MNRYNLFAVTFALVCGLSRLGIASSPQSTTQKLGWVTDPTACTGCGGYYAPFIFKWPGPPQSLNQTKTNISSNSSSVSLTDAGTSILIGQVHLYQQGRDITADKLSIQRKEGEITRLHALGHVYYNEPQMRIVGDEAIWLPQENKGRIDHAVYRLSYTQATTPANKNGTTNSAPGTGYAHGSATTIHQTADKKYTLQNTTYTSCAPDKKTWQLNAQQVDLDQTTGRGYAYNTTLDIAGVPVFYTPYINFPIDDRRQSGFLYGDYSYGKNNGFAATAPYYLNLAPNYDATITPALYSFRGVLLETEFRYLTEKSAGQINAGLMPHDRKDGHSRYALFYGDITQLNENWTLGIDYGQASDYDYNGDFGFQENPWVSATGGGQVLNGLTENNYQLGQNILLRYQHDNTLFSTSFLTYDVTDDSLLTDNRYYSELPQIIYQTHKDLGSGYTFSIDSQMTQFYKPQDDTSTTPPVTGNRLYLAPKLSWSTSTPAWYLTPSMTVIARNYALEDNDYGNESNQISQATPMIDLDTGVYFDREVNYFGTDYQQTLQPRLYYLLVPYQDQSNIPLFDTGTNTFSFDQLFSNNRFYGYDRIGDTNQVSAALTTTFIRDSDGASIVSAGIGQAYYINHRKVGLVTTPTDEDDGTSPIASYLNLQLSAHTSLYTEADWDTENDQWSYYTAQFRAHLDEEHLFNLSYTHTASDWSSLSESEILAGDTPPKTTTLMASDFWKLTNAWRIFDGYAYTWTESDHRATSVFAGAEYSTCCWAIRLMFAHSIDGTDPNNPSSLEGDVDNTLMLQFELKGLGHMGSSGMNDYLSLINGYDQDPGFTVT